MKVFVGSTNPVKINAVKVALAEKYPEAEVVGFEVPSQVSAQPMSDAETQQGAVNRAHAALEQGLAVSHVAPAEVVLAVGLEGGVLLDEQDQMWSTVWAAVIDQAGQEYVANGARVKVPAVIADPIRRGEEMGPIMEKLCGQADVRKKQGMFGVITKDYVSRTEEYGAIAKIAVGLWYGRDWADTCLESNNSL